MGIQTNYWNSIESRTCIKNLFGCLKKPTAPLLISVFFLVGLLTFEYAFAQETEAVNAIPLQKHSETSSTPSAVNTISPTKNHSSPASLSIISQGDIEELTSQMGILNDERLQLDNAWRIERNKYDSMKLRIDDSKKAIRLEMDEVLVNNSPRARLDNLLSQHETLSQDQKEITKQVTLLEEKLAAQQLLYVQANRDLTRMQTLYASQQREQDIQRVQEIARFLDRELRFSEQLSFKCSPSKSLAACLNDYPLNSRIESWVQEHYQAALGDELAEKVDEIKVSSDWYSTQINRNFTEASISLDGSVSAKIEVHANVAPRKMMACALLKTSADLCELQSASLIVRSNKYGDQVYINNKSYGSTPLSVMLDSGIYNVEVKYQGLTQKRTLTLDENRHLNFVF